MAWLWSSWQEYFDAVQPVVLNSPGLLRGAQKDSLFETDRLLFKATDELKAALNELGSVGFTGDRHHRPPSDAAVIDGARTHAVDLVAAGEELLLYRKRLANTRNAYGFLHQHDLLEHWDRYRGTARLAIEIDQLAADAYELLNGYRELITLDEEFLVRDTNLPEELKADFRLARNLFSKWLGGASKGYSGRSRSYEKSLSM